MNLSKFILILDYSAIAAFAVVASLLIVRKRLLLLLFVSGAILTHTLVFIVEAHWDDIWAAYTRAYSPDKEQLQLAQLSLDKVLNLLSAIQAGLIAIGMGFVLKKRFMVWTAVLASLLAVFAMQIWWHESTFQLGLAVFSTTCLLALIIEVGAGTMLVMPSKLKGVRILGLAIFAAAMFRLAQVFGALGLFDVMDYAFQAYGVSMVLVIWSFARHPHHLSDEFRPWTSLVDSSGELASLPRDTQELLQYLGVELGQAARIEHPLTSKALCPMCEFDGEFSLLPSGGEQGQCFVREPSKAVIAAGWTDESLHFTACPSCREPIVLRSMARVSQAEQTGDAPVVNEVSSASTVIWPPNVRHLERGDIPIGIRRDMREVSVSMANSCFRAAAMLLRRVLEKTLAIYATRIGEIESTKHGSFMGLERLIKRLKEQGQIAPDIAKCAHTIRWLGNAASHGRDFDTDEGADLHDVDPRDVENCWQLTVQVLDAVFVNQQTLARLEGKFRP